ncbi:TPA: hypothetical protein JAN57_05125 [Legionella pneumophila]|nr:hypothetical protein [Legionella pneumophila]HAU1655834.1 hypothetical protein [Legionella pneumophila]
MKTKFELNEELFNFVHNKLKNGATYREIQQCLKGHTPDSIRLFFLALTCLKHGKLTIDLFNSEVREFQREFRLLMEAEYELTSPLYLKFNDIMGLDFSQSQIEEFKKMPKNNESQTWSPTFKFSGKDQEKFNINEALLALEDFLSNSQENLTLT